MRRVDRFEVSIGDQIIEQGRRATGST